MFAPAHFVDQSAIGDLRRCEFFSEMFISIHPEWFGQQRVETSGEHLLKSMIFPEAAHELRIPVLLKTAGGYGVHPNRVLMRTIIAAEGEKLVVDIVFLVAGQSAFKMCRNVLLYG